MRGPGEEIRNKDGEGKMQEIRQASKRKSGLIYRTTFPRTRQGHKTRREEQ